MASKAITAASPKFDPAIHDENPEWTEEMFARAKPAKDFLPPEILAQFKNKGGRPPLESPKEAVKLRLDADVLAALRKSGPGWQTRINAMLRSHLKRGKIVLTTLSKRSKPATARPAKRKRA